MQGTRKQHTVAQSYLRRFTKDGARLFAFNKPDGRVFCTSVENVAQEAFFYDIPADVMIKAAEEGVPKIQFMEKLLANADGVAKTTIDQVLEQIKRKPIASSLRAALANL